MKRRRISQVAVTPAQPASNAHVQSASITRGSRRRTASKIFAIAEDTSASTEGREDNVHAEQTDSPPFVSENMTEKENVAPDGVDEDASTQQPQLPSTKRKRPRKVASPPPEAASEPVDEGDEQAEEADTTMQSEGVVPSAEVPSVSRSLQRRGRTSLVGAAASKRKRRGLTPRSSSVVQPRTAPASSPVAKSAPPAPTQTSRAKLNDRITKYSKLAQRRLQQAVAAVSDREEETRPRQQDDDETQLLLQDDEEEDQSYIEKPPEPPTPAVRKRRPKNPRKRPRTTSLEAPATKQTQTKQTFPFLTHRLAQPLPMIPEDEETSTPAPDITLDTRPTRAIPNAVDVLAQICRETILNWSSKLPAGTTASERKTATNKRTALQAFAEDLDDELFTMSEAVENRMNLEARVRKSRREKSELQSEYLELRKERERIALEIDRVRREHWECEEETRQKWVVSEMARRTEREIEMHVGEADDEGLEFLLRSVTDAVSSKGRHRGILDRVKVFNARLERMALLLEGRSG
jgi:hypothetical protein